MAVSQALAGALAAERKVFNARVAAARTRKPGFDTARFAAFLEAQADPLVTAVAAAEPDAVRRCVSALFNMGLALVGQGFADAGLRARLAGRVWREIAPGIVPLIAADPVESLGALTNVAIQVGGIDRLDGDHWIALMTTLAPEARDTRELRALAVIAAWRSGAAHLRAGALAAANSLPSVLACAACGTSRDDWPAVAEGYARNVWWRPDPVPTDLDGHSVGQFTGFGGRFAEPPRVRAAEQGFFVASGERTFLLIADAYGATLHQASAEEFVAAPAVAPGLSVSLQGDEVFIEGRRVRIDWPVDGLAVAANPDSVAVTSPYSHAIRLMPRVLQ